MTHGRIDYLQLPASDIATSARFYATVFDWSVDEGNGGFTAPGVIGRWTTDRAPSSGGPLVWIRADDLYVTLTRATGLGGRVVSTPILDGGERWLAEIEDPAGNRIGIVVHVRAPRPQPLITVRDVEASSAWYQRLLGLKSDHGGPHYERLLAGGELVLQLHHRDTPHHHGRIGDPEVAPGHGMLLWFGDVSDFDEVVARAGELGAPVVLEPHRNPPDGEGNGPAHREVWITDPDGYTVVVASPDGEAWH